MSSRLQHTLFVLALALPVTLHASDYTYQQTTQITGGSLLHMMKTVGVFSSQARHMGDPIVSTIYLKDNRLANVSAESIEIIDLDKETITNIDVQKKTYTVMTFEQMRQAIGNARAQLQQQAAQQPAQQPTSPPANTDAQNVKMSFDVKVRNTGAQKEISGLQSSESILTLMLNATDTQTDQSGSMAVTNDMWMVPAIPGYDQVGDFYKRFAAKVSDATVGLGFDFSTMLAQNPAAGQALSDMAGEMQKLSGVPIMQVMRMGTTVNGQPLPAASEALLPPDPSPAAPSAGQVAKAGMSSAIASRLGGFGFGKKKSSPPDNTADQNTAAAPSQPSSAILMETQISTSNFSSAPVDPSHFDIPAGYKLVQSPTPVPPPATASPNAPAQL
jgi:hypothetical protein